MARPVSLQEVADWVAENENSSWSHAVLGHKDTQRIFKYLSIRFDSRDMVVFHIEFDEKFQVDVRDTEDDNESILDLASRILEDVRRERDDRKN